jgi:hypothetical protein
MAVLAYTPDYAVIIGQTQKNVSFLPTLQNGKYYNPIADINANIASIGASLLSSYWIDWNVTVVNAISAGNTPILQSPLKSSYLGILAVLSAGSVVSQNYINFQSQRFPCYGFWTQLPAEDYPGYPRSVVVGSTTQIASATTAGSPPGDSFCIYPQYVDPVDFDIYFNFRATILSTAADFVLTDYPPQSYFY